MVGNVSSNSFGFEVAFGLATFGAFVGGGAIQLGCTCSAVGNMAAKALGVLGFNSAMGVPVAVISARSQSAGKYLALRGLCIMAPSALVLLVLMILGGKEESNLKKE